MSVFRRTFTAIDADIDELGHVNNAVWVQWVQDLATSHWTALAPPEHQAAYVWVVTRHEIDYRRNIAAGDAVTGATWVDGAPRGARFDRRFRFTREDDTVAVEGVSTWALLDRTTGRLLRVRAEIAAPFLVQR